MMCMSMASGSFWNTLLNASRILWTMTCLFANAMFAAQTMAP